ncbi:MAG: HD domain-containing protein [Actinomycetota bacterium]|nr:HD domain-containing protein [Actinomycetota bacterium]
MRFGSAAHLARRFAGSLGSGGPTRADEAWVATVLSRPELELWGRMSGADRRHAVGVAQRVQDVLGQGGSPAPVLAAALLHDVGKVEAGLGPLGRVVATLAGMAGRRSLTPSIERYLRHDALGAELLRGAGSDPLTVTWAAEHHLPPRRWTVPPAIGSALKAADDD